MSTTWTLSRRVGHSPRGRTRGGCASPRRLHRKGGRRCTVEVPLRSGLGDPGAITGEEPKMRRLVVAVIASGWALAGASAAQAAPTVTLSPSFGPPTTSVKLTGAGFDAPTSADVFV